MADPAARLLLRVSGIVQGVGFRPFVHALATRHGLQGYVLNDSGGVVIEVEGPADRVEAFPGRLRAEAPPASRIFSIDASRHEPAGYRGFEIRHSLIREGRDVPIPPDIATCGDCLREVFDPADRRHRYPFTNCTNCGPRFTLAKDVPYDRPRTTMAAFTMCALCRAEYENPSDRRFHAQPNACPACGPRLALLDAAGAPVRGDDPLRRASELLRGGAILAVKGLGGYHLACDAADDDAVARLRERKRRRDEPFALMVRDLEAARRLAHVDDAEAALLRSPTRPIVLVRRREGARVAADVAPRQNYLGLMLPYTPLHHLLLADSGLDLVMTSGNLHDEPIAFKDPEALERLRGIADFLLAHDREIHVRCDDSVTRVVNGRETMIRRSRGCAPSPLRFPFEFARPTLAVGALLKNTFCLAKKNLAYLGPHVGDLENLPTLESYEQGLEHFRRFFDIRPEVAAHDLHPDYLSTRHALSLEGVEKVGVQHHLAHVAAGMADNNLAETVIGVAFDGTGYGLDGRIWGGEFLVAGPGVFDRAGHLDYRPLPGGDAAVREPWRMAVSHLAAAFGDGFPDLPFLRETDPATIDLVRHMIRKGLNSPLTSSMGRLFDAVAALAGIRSRVTYEAQAAIELEMAADEAEDRPYPFPVLEGNVVDPSEAIREIAADLGRGVAAGVVAGKFHAAVARMTADVCARIRRERGHRKVVLTGGVYQNSLLLRKTVRALEAAGLEPYWHHQVPPNDGGLSLGQAVVADWRSRCAWPSR
jgi:hydrogenase maturation protein HypF